MYRNRLLSIGIFHLQTNPFLSYPIALRTSYEINICNKTGWFLSAQGLYYYRNLKSLPMRDAASTGCVTAPFIYFIFHGQKLLLRHLLRHFWYNGAIGRG